MLEIPEIAIFFVIYNICEKWALLAVVPMIASDWDILDVIDGSL